MKKIATISFAILVDLSTVCAYYAHANGPSYACPNSEVSYTYSTDMPSSTVRFTITNGKIFNVFSQTWETVFEFDQSSNPNLNETYPFRVKWDNLPIGYTGNVNVRVTQLWHVEGNRAVTFDGSPDYPVIAGNGYILNCQSQQQVYNVTVLPENWNLVDWNYTSQIQEVSTGYNSTTVEGVNTSYTGGETLTGVFEFTTGGVTCATRNVNKLIWLGAPAPASQTVNGNSYYYGYEICPGSNWVGVSWFGSYSFVSWQVWAGGSYYTTDTQADFDFPITSSSAMISAIASNACGSSYSATWHLNKKNFGCSSSFTVSAYPNPVTNELTVESIKSGDGSETMPVPIADEVTIYNKLNVKVFSENPSVSKLIINTKDLPRGEYILNVTFGRETIRKHILIAR